MLLTLRRLLTYYIGVDPLALDLMGVTHDRGFHNIGAFSHRIFTLSGTQSVPRAVQNIIYSSCTAVISSRIAAAAISGRVVPSVGIHVGLQVALMIAPDGSGNSRPGILNA